MRIIEAPQMELSPDGNISMSGGVFDLGDDDLDLANVLGDVLLSLMRTDRD